ncbi:MAG TPA: SH3 domain-containing protein [Anaerolineales bacterium]|nr:SH3 domain-containing protein [Anaerolineales bacterium]
MMNRRWITAVFIILILTACNIPANETSTPPPSQPTLDTPQAGDATPTRIPIETLLVLQLTTVTSTSTPGLSIAFPIDQPVNCRSGPGTSYIVIGELKPGRQAEMIGKSPDLAWWYVKNPSDPSTFCWLAAFLVNTEGNVESLPLVNPPEVAVTAVDVSIQPPVINVACDGFPLVVTINIQITTSGPATVTWRWETDTGDFSAEESLLFEEGGTKSVQDLYQVKSARDYTIFVRTYQPNEFMGNAVFKATCTP